MAIPHQKPPYKRHKPNSQHRRKGQGTPRRVMDNFNNLSCEIRRQGDKTFGHIAVDRVPGIFDREARYIWHRHLGGSGNRPLSAWYPFAGRWASVGVFTLYAVPSDDPLVGISQNIFTQITKFPSDSVWIETANQQDSIIALWQRFAKHMTRRHKPTEPFNSSYGLGYPPERVLFVMSFHKPMVLFDATAKSYEQRRTLKAAMADTRQAKSANTRAVYDYELPNMLRDGRGNRTFKEYKDMQLDIQAARPETDFSKAEDAYAIALEFMWHGVWGFRKQGEDLPHPKYTKYQPKQYDE